MPELKIGQRKFRLPANRIVRIGLGGLFVLLGLLGFLPVLGFWMIPVGLLILSHDFPAVRRLRRKATLWWMRRRAARASQGAHI
jgi:purine-cytosine permease-like protein